MLVAVCTTFLTPQNLSAYDFTALDENGNTIYYKILFGGESVEVVSNSAIEPYSGEVIIPNIVNDVNIHIVLQVSE